MFYNQQFPMYWWGDGWLSLRNIWKLNGQKKPRPLEISHYFSLVILGKSTSFLINPSKFCMLFPWYSWKFHTSTPSVWLFSGIAQLAYLLRRVYRLLVKLIWNPSIPIFLSFKNAHWQNVLKNAAYITEKPYCGTVLTYTTSDN